MRLKTLIRTIAVATLVAAQQLVAPLGGLAQVDPCHPVPIPELCDVIEPSPSPSPSPKGPKPGRTEKPAPTENPEGGGKGKAEDQQDGKGKGKGNGKNKKEEEGPLLVPSEANNSARLIELLSPLARYGMPLQSAVMRVVGPFPVAGLSYWTDDWHACRAGCTRLHEGLDIFAETGTPLVAAADGIVTQKYVGELPGISIEIQDANGIQYFYAHLSDWAPGIEIGDQVHAGQLLGYVGNTGNAIYTPPHVHFEFQPGGIPAPPKPLVDKWIKLAELEAEALAARVMAKDPPEASSFRLTRAFDLAGGAEILEPSAERLLALAGIQPSVSSLEMARRLLGQMSWEIDWAGQTDAQLAALAQQAATLSDTQDLSGASPWEPFGTQPTPSTSAGIPEQGD